MCDGGWREENMDLHEEIRELEAENERLRKLMLIVDEMVGEDIKAYCSEQTNREWREAISEPEES
jgi:hypothetical protein